MNVLWHLRCIYLYWAWIFCKLDSLLVKIELMHLKLFLSLKLEQILPADSEMKRNTCLFSCIFLFLFFFKKKTSNEKKLYILSWYQNGSCKKSVIHKQTSLLGSNYKEHIYINVRLPASYSDSFWRDWTPCTFLLLCEPRENQRKDKKEKKKRSVLSVILKYFIKQFCLNSMWKESSFVHFICS